MKVLDLQRKVNERLDGLEERLLQDDELMQSLSQTEDPAVARAILHLALRSETRRIVSAVAQEYAAEIAQAEEAAVRRQVMAGEAFTVH